ncbi:MAG: NADH:ubiquinone oxidoreductase subunit NDUFA12 [Alphaproteobacteria bacterium]
MRQLLLQIFTWWSGQTVGTRFHTWRKGTAVGSDDTGNRYYVDTKTGRRWVIYDNLVEASKVPPGWNAWLHYTSDEAPSETDYQPRSWQKPHIPNMTGTPLAYRPPGSIVTAKQRPQVTGDYDPWDPSPEDSLRGIANRVRK